MAEQTLNFSLEYLDSDGNTGGPPSIEDLLITQATKKKFETIQSIGATQEAIGLGDFSALGTMVLINLDATRYIEIKVATSGAVCAKLWPRGSASGINFCVIPLGSGMQAPFAIAETQQRLNLA